MKKKLTIFYFLLTPFIVWCQDDCIIETKFHNCIDTTSFYSEPTLLLFVHSKHQGICPSERIQKALEQDSLSLRETYNIYLYVMYVSSRCNTCDINDYESYNPSNSSFIFYVEPEKNSPRFKKKGLFGESESVPFIIFYDGKGLRKTFVGGTYDVLYDEIIKIMSKKD